MPKDIRIINYLLNTLLTLILFYCFYNIYNNFHDSLVLVSNSLSIFLILFYFINFEKKLLNKLIPRKISPKLKIVLKYKKQITSYFFLFTLLLITLNQFDAINKYLDLSNYQTLLTILAIASGALTFWQNKERIEKETEEEQNKEELAEQKRKEEFPQKYPKINKVPILKNVVRWMYKEGWGFSAPFVLIALIFIGIKIGMPIVYTGSYIGEYYNIIAGVHLFEHGSFADFYNRGPYMRGAYVSFFVGLFTFIFGKSIFVAKMIPAIIGIFNFFLLYSIAKQLINKKIIILTLLIIYTISPFIIFNHFFIRFYVFYELFLLTNLFLFFKILDFVNNKKIVKTTFFISILIIFNILVYLFSNDSGSYIILSSLGLFFIYLFFKYRFFIDISKIYKKINLIFNFTLTKKIIILLILMATVLIFFDIPNKLSFLLEGGTAHPASHNYGFNYLFNEIHYIYTIFFILSLFIIFLLKNDKLKITGIIIFFIFILHYISHPDLQLIRAMTYFLGIFYLFSLVWINYFYKLSFLFISILLIIPIFTIINKYPNNYFSNGPYLIGESPYTEFKDAFDFLKNKKEDTVIIAVISAIPYLTNFYNIHTNYFLNFTKEKKSFIDNNSKEIILGNIPIINNLDNNKYENTCIIIREPSSGFFLNNYRDYIENKFSITKKKFIQITIYCNY